MFAAVDALWQRGKDTSRIEHESLNGSLAEPEELSKHTWFGGGKEGLCRVCSCFMSSLKRLLTFSCCKERAVLLQEVCSGPTSAEVRARARRTKAMTNCVLLAIACDANFVI